MKKIILFMIILFSIGSAGVSIFSELQKGYTLLPFLPLTFLFVYIFFLHRSIFHNKSIVAAIFSVYGFFRYIILPFSISISHTYGVDYIVINNESYYHKAFSLMMYELITLSLLLYFLTSKMLKLESRENREIKNVVFEIKGLKFFYLLFIFIAVILFFLYPGATNLLSFLTIESSGGERAEEDLPLNLMIMRQIFLTAIAFAYILLIAKINEFYNKNKSVIYIYAAVLISFLHIAIIVGERRSVQVYTAFVTIYLLSNLFKKHKNKIILMIALSASIVLIGMTVYKTFYAFSYNSYLEAIAANMGQGFDLANYLQLYFLGPQNIAATILFNEYFAVDFRNLFYDISRSILGLSFLVKDLDMSTTTNLFNTFIYGTQTDTGHILSGIGYGYLYFGFILSPIIPSIILFSSILIERALRRTKSLEIAYLLSYILIRSSLGIFSSLTAFLNVFSLMMLSFGLVYIVIRTAKILLLRKKFKRRGSEFEKIP